MIRYDLCFATNWEYDTDFIRLLDSACAARGLTLLTVTARNLAESLSRLAQYEAGFCVLLDRASEADPAYLPIVDIARVSGARRINPRELADRAYDKAAMHHVLCEAGLQTPPTIILPSHREQPDLPALDLTPLGGLFAIKPAFGGGGDGVVTKISTLDQVLAERQQFPQQKYLLHTYITPKVVNGLPAWFRVIYSFGEIHPSFWNTTTHVYTRLTSEQEIRFGLTPLREITERIARICGLDLFSTEIALTEAGQFLLIDYINDPIDLRLQSRAKDGVPDAIVTDIAAHIAEAAKASRATR